MPWLALLAAPIGLIVAAAGIFDKGLEFSSTAGRLTYWGDLARLLVEYPLTGSGLGVDTANRVALQYEINPDPERIFYAHNTFVQSYLEMGPLGALGMLGVPLIALAAALVARREGVASATRVAGRGPGPGRRIDRPRTYGSGRDDQRRHRPAVAWAGRRARRAHASRAGQNRALGALGDDVALSRPQPCWFWWFWRLPPAGPRSCSTLVD